MTKPGTVGDKGAILQRSAPQAKIKTHFTQTAHLPAEGLSRVFSVVKAVFSGSLALSWGQVTHRLITAV